MSSAATQLAAAGPSGANSGPATTTTTDPYVH